MMISDRLTMEKIRLMHLIHELGTGGAENGIINIVNHIDHTRFKTSICAFAGGGSQTERVDMSRTDLAELNKHPGNDFTLPIRLCRLFRKWKPHIVHTHAWGTLCEGAIGAKLARVPVIIHGEHGTIQDRQRNIPIQRFFWNLTDQILSVSHAHRDRLAKTINYPSDKIEVIINGVDTVCFSAQKKNESIRKELGIDNKDIVIGTVGRLVPVKNHSMLIEAFAIISRRYSNIKLVLVGDGPLKSELIKLSDSLEISSNVVFTGRRDDIPEILRCMDIFVLSSHSEGMSNTILEAMSSGLPVIATDVGGNPSLVDKDITGLLVESEKPGSLAELLSRLIDCPELRIKMGNAGRKRVEQKFSLQAMVKNYENLYMKLIKKACSL